MGKRLDKVIHCPKCRALGLTTDCLDQIGHAVSSENIVDIDISVRFAVTETLQDGQSPQEAATRLWEMYLSKPWLLVAALDEAVGAEEFSLVVRPIMVD